MSGLIKQLRSAIIQQFQDNGRYSSKGARSGVSSMGVEPEPPRDPFKDLEEVINQVFLSVRNPKNKRDLPGCFCHIFGKKIVVYFVNCIEKLFANYGLFCKRNGSFFNAWESPSNHLV